MDTPPQVDRGALPHRIANPFHAHEFDFEEEGRDLPANTDLISGREEFALRESEEFDPGFAEEVTFFRIGGSSPPGNGASLTKGNTSQWCATHCL